MNFETNSSTHPARKTLTPVHFYCQAPEAKRVEITGDFNRWQPVGLQRRPDGWWYLQAQLPHGHHQYRFLVDGIPTLDPRATGVGHDEAGEAVSIVAVS